MSEHAKDCAHYACHDLFPPEIADKNGVILPPYMENTLKNYLSEWTDWDWAAFGLALSLGLMEEDAYQTRAKHVFWGENPIGRMLFAQLDLLVEQGILEKRDEPDMQYRWSPSFVGSWETPARTNNLP